MAHLIPLLLFPVAMALDMDYRLPRNIRPISYNVHLNFSLDVPLQSGLVMLTFKTLESLRDLVLHSRHHVFLEQGSLNCTESRLSRTLPFPYRDMDKQIAAWESLDLPQGVTCTATIPYFWSLRLTDNRGPFFESHATFHLITKFQPIYARLLFPCLDEPDRKATFQVNVYLDKRYYSTVLVRSNMETKGMPRIHSNSRGLVHLDYMPTPMMSTYLLAITISNATLSLATSHSRRYLGLKHLDSRSTAIWSERRN